MWRKQSPGKKIEHDVKLNLQERRIVFSDKRDVRRDSDGCHETRLPCTTIRLAA